MGKAESKGGWTCRAETLSCKEEGREEQGRPGCWDTGESRAGSREWKVFQQMSSKDRLSIWSENWLLCIEWIVEGREASEGSPGLRGWALMELFFNLEQIHSTVGDPASQVLLTRAAQHSQRPSTDGSSLPLPMSRPPQA